jgi:hypothetical protein
MEGNGTVTGLASSSKNSKSSTGGGEELLAKGKEVSSKMT